MVDAGSCGLRLRLRLWLKCEVIPSWWCFFDGDGGGRGGFEKSRTSNSLVGTLLCITAQVLPLF